VELSLHQSQGILKKGKCAQAYFGGHFLNCFPMIPSLCDSQMDLVDPFQCHTNTRTISVPTHHHLPT